MTVPASSIKLRDVRNEFGQTSGQYSLRDAAEESINDCSAGGDQIAPYILGGWANYDHTAIPAAASGFSGNPGDDSSPNSDPQQDSHVYMSWNPIICAGAYDVLRSTTSGGSFSVIANDISDEFYVDNIASEKTSRYYKVRGISGAPTDGTLTSELHLRTTPTLPQSVGNDNGDASGNCSSMVIVVSWSNGTSPGVRVSSVRYRWRKLPAAFSGAELGPTTAGVTTFSQNVGSVSNDDQFQFELRYNEEGSATVTTTATVLCFDP